MCWRFFRQVVGVRESDGWAKVKRRTSESVTMGVRKQEIWSKTKNVWKI